VKPSHGVKAGDTVTFTRNAVVFECVVTAVPLRRVPASEAARCYDETPASKARREEFAARMKVAGRPNTQTDDRRTNANAGCCGSCVVAIENSESSLRQFSGTGKSAADTREALR